MQIIGFEDVKSLCIGNYVLCYTNKDEKYYTTIKTIDENNFTVNIDLSKGDIIKIEPIPISREILLACGWNYYNGKFSGDLTHDFEGKLDIDFINDKLCIKSHYENDTLYRKLYNIKFLHQLQNFASVINGVELDIDLQDYNNQFFILVEQTIDDLIYFIILDYVAEKTLGYICFKPISNSSRCEIIKVSSIKLYESFLYELVMTHAFPNSVITKEFSFNNLKFHIEDNETVIFEPYSIGKRKLNLLINNGLNYIEKFPNIINSIKLI